MRLLVFCGTRRALERFDMDPDWDTIVSVYPIDVRNQKLVEFRKKPNAKLAVDRSMIHGWRAPDDTTVLFDPSWSYPLNGPESLQAVSRTRAIAGLTGHFVDLPPDQPSG